MIQALVLALPNFTKHFVVEVDACGTGVGAVLMQQGHPIAFLSQALGQKHLGLSTYEKELIALLLVIEKWRHYLQPIHFVITTNHFNLNYFRDQRVTTSLQHKGLTKLLGLSYEIRYRKGSENVAVDALSRRFEKEVDCQAMTLVQPAWVQEVLNSYEGDSEVSKVLSSLLLDANSIPDVLLQQGILRHKGQIWIGNGGHYRQKLIEAMHLTAWGGHSGVLDTQQRLRALFYWPGLLSDVKKFVSECDNC